MLGLVALTPEGNITREEFMNFYSDLSLNMVSDAAFCKFVSSHWDAPYKQKEQPSIEQIKEAIKIIRFKLLQMVEGTHEEFVLKRVFDEFDLNKNGSLCK